MGNISSRPDEGAPIYLRDQQRFSISSISVFNSKQRALLHVVPDAFPAHRALAKRDPIDESPIEFIQDTESSQGSSYPDFLLRLDNSDELNFVFTFVVRQGPSPEAPQASIDSAINGLTFIFAPSAKDLDVLATREFHADPNFHKNPNVELVKSEITTGGSPSVQLNYNWKWRPPKPSEDKGGGWRNVCAFLEYDQRAHKLSTLASFSFWVQNTRSSIGMQTLSPQADMLGLPRIRVASSQSAHTLMSDSEGATERDLPSPANEAENTQPLTQSSTNTVVDVACQRPGEDLSAVDDGPLFRATMKALEQKTGNMKGRMKKLLKKAEAAQVAQVQCNEAVAQFMDALRDAAASNATAIQPALEHYFEKIARQILKYEYENSANLQKLIIDPLSKLYNFDIKQAESKKRDFEDESKDFYAYVGRYLGQRQDSLKEKKRIESDSKYQNKRRNFELKRFDYSSFMQDLHGGRKEQEVLSYLTRFADSQTKSYLSAGRKIEELVPQLDALVREVTEADKEFRIQRTEREEKRRNLEKTAKPYTEGDPTNANGAMNGTNPAPDAELVKSEGSGRAPLQHSNSTSSQPGSVPTGGASLGPSNSLKSLAGSPGTSPGYDRFKTARDVEEKENGLPTIGERAPLSLQRKEGLLWALSRPGSHADPRGLNKQAWHKYWIVLDQGKLSEYSNWKERLDLHMEPIDLRLASVREARNSERRFCFEIITPNFKRVYQATSEDDMNNWIGAINNALQGAFEARSPTQSYDPSPTETSLKRDIGSVLTGKSPTSNLRDPSNYPSPNTHQASNSSLYRRITVGARPSYIRSNSSSYEENPKKLLLEIRERDEANAACADCNSKTNTDWVSINLGVIICIECSGVHRSLGTHVSKVRSLTLDTVSFTVDIVELIMTIGNRNGNKVWEARLGPTGKPGPSSAWEERRRFITDKYVQRAYVSPISSTLSAFGTADETLLASIKRNDINQVLYALALQADPNATDKSRHSHAVFLALAAADPATPHPSPLVGGSGPGGRPTPFSVAELLLQNGSAIPATLPAFPLSTAAQQFIEQKRSKETVSALPQIRNPGAPAERERERLQKRTSTGARFNARSMGL